MPTPNREELTRTVMSASLPVDQRYLFEARQMQALSLSVHIPLVCFGIEIGRASCRERVFVGV